MNYVSPSKECPRCRAETHMSAEAQPHLCADIAKRLARRERQVEAVMHLLMARGISALDAPVTDRQVAEAIVAKLANMGVEND